MKPKLHICIISVVLLFLFISPVKLFAYQAAGNVSGKVMDEQGNPITGVTVAVKGTTIGTITDNDGNYTLQVENGQTIVFSSIGYKTREIQYTGQAHIDVTLEVSSTQLNEIVAIGYGTIKRADVTGSVTTVKAEDFNKGAFTNPIGLIQGKVPGLIITRTQGSNPNGGYQILLRGLNTLSGGKQPLIIVDGIIGGNTLQMLDPNEIASVDVLKDGSAAAIYGTRATNGVILITTKKPKLGKVHYEFSSHLSTEIPSENRRYLSADEYRQVIHDYYPDQEESLDKGYSTDWLNKVIRKPITQYYSFAATGGTENISFRTDLYYKDNEGIVKQTYAKTVTPSVVVSSTGLNGRLKINARLMYSFIKRKGGNNGVIFQAISRNPTYPVYDPSDVIHGGYYTITAASGQPNPVAMINEHENNVEAEFFTGDVAVEYRLLKDLKLKLHYSFNSKQNYRGTYKTRYFPDLGANGDATVSANFTHDQLFEPGIAYDKTIDDHHIQVIAGYSYFENQGEDLGVNNYNFDVDDFSYYNVGSGYALDEGLASMGTSKATNKLISFYGRALYNYKQKYLLSISARYEGSSRFGANNKWGLFPAISAGWRVTEENFARNSSWLSNLKLRAGYGVTGNQDIPNYQSLSRIGISSREFYYNGQWVNAYKPSSNPNPNLKWEKKGEFDVGIDFGLLQNRITGTVDYYYRRVSDLLWRYAVPVPPNVYPTTYANVGIMENKGMEFSISANIVKTSNLLWSSTLLYSQNRNKLVSFSDAARGYKLDFLKINSVTGTWSQLVLEGQPVGNFVAPVYTGVDDKGDAVYKDLNGDGKIDLGSQDDRAVVGNAYPKFQIGWSNQLKYKNFDLSFFFRGVFGQSLLNYERVFFENWQPFLAGRNILKSTLAHPEYKGIQTYDSRFVEKASYIKLNSLALGYTLHIANDYPLRIYASCQDLFTISDYQGADPEAPVSGFGTTIGPSGSGNLIYYPYTVTFLFGINLKF